LIWAARIVIKMHRTVRLLLIVIFILSSPVTVVNLAVAAQATSDPVLADALAQQLAEQNATPGLSFRFAEVGRTLQAALGVVYIGRVDKTSGQWLPGRSDLWGVALEQGQWHVYRPGDLRYGAFLQQLEQLANPFIDPEFTAGPLLVSRVGVAATNLLTDYQLPWSANAWATVTRSYAVHGVGQIDFVLDANNQAITVAKDGVIIYANDSHSLNTMASGAWWYWNTVVIQHGSQEFSMAAHLLPNSVPAWIKAQCSTNYGARNCAVPIRAGQVIGTQGNTGTSSGAHLHFATGQSFVNDARADTLDEDGDGNTSELIHTGYAWTLQNVAFAGYSDTVVANWPVNTRLQAPPLLSPPTATSTPTATPSATQTATPTATLTPTPSLTPTSLPRPSQTPLPTETATATVIPTAPPAYTPTPDEPTPTVTATVAQLTIPTPLAATTTPLPTITATPTATATTELLLPITPTPSPSATPTWTPTLWPTIIELPTVIPANTPEPTVALISTTPPTVIPTVPPIWPTVPVAVSGGQPRIFLPFVQTTNGETP
jgi:murein DD-endopeptidase MepM/ murein hydrolase activator NlpD